MPLQILGADFMSPALERSVSEIVFWAFFVVIKYLIRGNGVLDVICFS